MRWWVVVGVMGMIMVVVMVMVITVRWECTSYIHHNED